MQKSEKAVLIDSIRAAMDKADLAVVTEFQGMTVEELTGLRVKLKANNMSYLVVKNTLARIALTGGRHEAIKDQLKLNCGIAMTSSDPVAMAKTLVDFAKTSKKFSIRFASLNGRFLSTAELEKLARLPGRTELLAKLLGTMNAVPSNLVGLLANIPRSLLYALNAIKDAKAS